MGRARPFPFPPALSECVPWGAQIQDGGGKVAASLTKAVQFLIVTEEEFEKGSAKVKNAEAKELPILKPSFVEVC